MTIDEFNQLATELYPDRDSCISRVTALDIQRAFNFICRYIKKGADVEKVNKALVFRVLAEKEYNPELKDTSVDKSTLHFIECLGIQRSYKGFDRCGC